MCTYVQNVECALLFSVQSISLVHTKPRIRIECALNLLKIHFGGVPTQCASAEVNFNAHYSIHIRRWIETGFANPPQCARRWLVQLGQSRRRERCSICGEMREYEGFGWCYAKWHDFRAYSMGTHKNGLPKEVATVSC